MKMVVEQTFAYPKRMIYHPESRTFTPSEQDSLAYVRNFRYPYGWIKESGTPPAPHCDCILMSERAYALGDEVEVRLIGLFRRRDGDHKYIVVEAGRDITDYAALPAEEMAALNRLYPAARESEGWFGRETALDCYEHCARAL